MRLLTHLLSYVPIKVDYTDIYDVLAFFIGTPDGQGGHDSIAEKMAEAGRGWATTYWRRVDMACVLLHFLPSSVAHLNLTRSYMYRLLLEYSRLLATGLDDDLDYYTPIEDFD